MRFDLHKPVLSRISLAFVVCMTAASAVTVVTTEPPVAAAAPTGGIWLSEAEITALPTIGPAWNHLKDTADESLGSADISDFGSDHDVQTLAASLVYARTGDASYRAKAANGIDAAMGTEAGGDILDLTRNLLGYVLAADLIDLAGHDQAADQRFRTWLNEVRTLVLDGRTLISTHEDRPNNWGAHAGASRIAVAIYLRDWADLDRAATVFKGWLGDRNAYAGFTYGDTSWQANRDSPVGVNAAGSTIDGHDVDGVLPDDQRRGGNFEWPPPCENYAREALQGVVVAATILTREGYPAFEWQDQALRRAGEWLVQVASCPFSGDDEFVPWLLNAAYETNFATESPANSGKAMGFTAWTHGAFAGTGIGPRGTFIDDDNSSHEPAIEAIYAAGLTVGCNSPISNRYCPNDPVTRAQMATFLVRAMGYSKGAGSDQFTDDDGSSHEADIERLYRAGITVGCNVPLSTRYCPNDPVTRAQMATFLVRAMGYSEGAGSDQFVDDDASSHEADIERLHRAGITVGCNAPVSSRYCPNDSVTRAEMATFLARVLDLI